MPKAKERKPFRDPLHRQIARACADEPLGPYAIARELGVGLKKISSPLKTMERAGLFQVEPSDGGSGKLYQLKPELMDALLEAAAEARDPGLLQNGQSLLLVNAADPNVVLRALAPSDLAAALAWGARTTGSKAAYLLAIEPSAGLLTVDAAIERLLEAGATVEHIAVNEVIAPADFQGRGKLMRHRKREAKAKSADY